MRKIVLILCVCFVCFSCQSSEEKLEEVACRIAKTVNKNHAATISYYKSGVSRIILGTSGLKNEIEKTYGEPVMIESQLNPFYLELCIKMAEKKCPEEGNKIRELYLKYNANK